VDLFEEQAPEAEVDPEIYAGAAGYLMDRGRISGIREMLIRSYQRDPLVPEVHYELARYSRTVQAPIQEREALENARQAFTLAEPLSRRRLIQQIDTDIRSGEYWYERREFLQARGDFDAARRRYETARESGFISAEVHLARLYARLADLEYFQGGDFEYALDRYDRAAAEGYETDELNYKRGFIHFVAGRFDQAVDRFYDIGSSNALVGPDTVLYARANTLFLRENFFGAEAFYRELLNRLDARRDAIPTLLVEENPTHRAIVENLIRVNNNLGVTLFRISERDVTEEERLSEGLSLLTESAELSENYLREDETGERAAATNLAFLNIRDILYPAGDFEPRIYDQLPRDITQELF
ncbi:MAG: hypothetical protein MI724_20170, partial [Spirochaetales bacterium]|nr:hypothetical protein [Spirochaetales bacterium]